MKTSDMTAEQFECRIPSPDAFKEGVLYCSSNATNAVDIWVAFGTVGSAVAAVGLAIWSIMDSRKSQSRAIEAEQREQAVVRRTQLLEYSRPILDQLEGMAEQDNDKLVDQSSALARQAFHYEISSGSHGPDEREFGETLRKLCDVINYIIVGSLHEPKIRYNDPNMSVTLGFHLRSGMIRFDKLVHGALIELAHAESEEEISASVANFKRGAKSWIAEYAPDHDDDI